MLGKKIIIIDDSELVRSMAADILKEAGYEVIATDSGIEANQHIYGPQKPDLILVDVMMPMLNGDRKVRLLKERESSSNIPILLISTKPSEELQELTRSSGADGFLQKPFNNRSLISAVERHLAA